MGKPLFSIACTTCRARIAVLREDAIGTILGCPKCGGMVMIVPPAGWVSAHAAELPTVAAMPLSGPPPITKVSQTFLTLDLEPEKPLSGWQKLADWAVQSNLILATSAASICIVGIVVWLLMASSRSNVEVAKGNAEMASPVAQTKQEEPKSVENPAEKPEMQTPVPANAIAEVPSNPNPPETKPEEATVAEVKPAEVATEEKKIEPKPLEENPAETKTEVKTVEAEPAAEEPAVKEAEPLQVAEADEAKPALRSIPDLPPAVEIKPMPADKRAALPVTAAKLVKQVAPQEIDAKSRLDDLVPSMKMTDIPLSQAVATLSTISALPITLDADAMRRQGVTPSDAISVDAKDCTVEELFDTILSPRGLGIEIEKGQVLVTASSEHADAIRTVPYNVSDMCENGQAAAQLAELLEQFVSPDSWQINGGPGSIHVVNESLTIEQTDAMQREIEVFCEKLRIARGLSPRGKLSEERLKSTSPYAQAKPLLDKKISANFHSPTTLSKIADNLGSRAGVEIIIDRRSLAAAGMSDKMEISYTIEKQPLEIALDGLLRPLGLGYRAIDSQTLQIATHKELDRRLEWEIYPVGKLLGPELGGRDLIEAVKQSAAPTSWTARSRIYFDSPSKSLIVLQTPAAQAAVFRYLSEKPAKK